MRQTVAVVIPTYRPEVSALLALVHDLRAQDLPLLVADDASPCTFDPALVEATLHGAEVVRHARNAGIARSLNDGLRFAERSHARWLLTVDQDSTLPEDYLTDLLAFVSTAEAALGPRSVGAIGAGSISDASGGLGYPVADIQGIPTTHELIQTGTLWSVDHLVAIGGFDESLGIDAVDAAACLQLRAAGLRIVIAPGVAISHRIGAGHQVRVLGRDVLASGHTPERRTTIVRNRLRLFPGEFAESPTHAFRTLRRVAMNTALAVTVEDDRWAKAKGAARGLLPGRGH